MIKSKALALLKTFTPKEFKKYELFVRSPYFNKENVQVKIYELLKRYYPEFNSPDLEKEKLYCGLYPGRKYNDGAMRNILSDMLKLAEMFLSVDRFRSQDFKKSIFLLETLKDKKLSDHFINQKEKTEKIIEEDIFKDELYFDRKSELAIIYARFLRETQDTFIQRDKVLQETSDLVTISSLIKLIYYNTDMLSVQSNISNITYNLNLADEIDSFFAHSGKKYLKIPYIEGYWLSFKLIQAGDEKYFYLLKDFIQRCINEINNDEIKNIFTILENYCYRKITEGRPEFLKEQFLLYRQSVERGNYTSVGFISSTLFMSIVVIGYEAGEFEWTNKFISEYISEVKEDSRNNTARFCAALKFYWNGNYESSLNELSGVTSEEFSFKQNIRSLTLKIYYELNETEPFYSHIDSYKHFIQNNKFVHNNVREPISNYISFTKKLFDLKNFPKKDSGFELHRLRKEISGTKALINKLWLLRKIDETGLK
jgi:hypothetical protein